MFSPPRVPTHLYGQGQYFLDKGVWKRPYGQYHILSRWVSHLLRPPSHHQPVVHVRVRLVPVILILVFV